MSDQNGGALQDQLAVIGRNIKIKREEKKITQEELALKCGCTMAHVSKIERGITLPSLEMFIRIANALETGVDYFLGELVTVAKPKYMNEELAQLLEGCPADLKRYIISLVRLTKDSWPKDTEI